MLQRTYIKCKTVSEGNWPPSGNELLARFNVYVHCISIIGMFVLTGLEGQISFRIVVQFLGIIKS